MNKKILFILLSGLLVACTGNTYFTESKPIDSKGWDMSESVDFTFDITDTTQCYDMLLYISNTTDYPHQNLWMKVEERQPGGNTEIDTIQIFLADNRGQWLGNGVGNLKEMPVIYRQKTQFHQVGSYTYSIQQLMRDTVLQGIHELGMRLNEVKPQKQN